MFTTSDPLNRSITLKSETYDYKISNKFGTNNNKEHGNSHPEITVQDIRNTVESPTYIFIDDEIIREGDNEVCRPSQTREEYIAIAINEEVGKLKSTKVIVEFENEEKMKGTVVTAFRESKVSKISIGKGGVVYDVHKR